MSSNIPSNISVLTGPILFANLMNWGLFGILTVQVYLYFLSFPKDKRLIMATVYSTYLIEIVQTALSTHDAFRIFGAGWGNPEVLDRVGWLGIMIPCLVSVLTFISQTFYAWRIWILRGSLWIPIPIISLSTVQLVAGLISGIRIQLLGVLSQVESHTHKTVAVRLVAALLCDIIIASSMLEFLFNRRRNTGVRRTQNILARLINLVVETGVILMLVAIVDLTFFLGLTHNNLFYAPSMCLSKLYSNVMLVMLNVRIDIVGGRTGTPDLEMSNATLPVPVVIPSSDSQIHVQHSLATAPTRKSALVLEWFTSR